MIKISTSNDDGYQALGLRKLADALKTLAEVEVIAPELNNSAKSNAITINAPLYLHEVEAGVRYVTGTPADSVHLALSGVLDYRPDLIISGINNGANMGDDTIYSGTVGAAMEGYLFGIPSIAFSLVEYGWEHLDDAVHAAHDVVRSVIERQLLGKQAWLLNVNIPNLPYEQIKPVRICRLGKRHAAESVIKQDNPRGQTMYWIGPAGQARDAGEGTDCHATSLGHISMTPLQIDLTAHDSLRYWAQGFAAEKA